ncbi:MAG: dihydropyrimidinase [Proteobacteria bacterium]|nr:dihydropyrimidinase [Pseudomonadota bacterium]
MDLILKNGTVVNAHETVAADIGIENGLIKRIGYDIGPAAREIDCSGKYVFPGGVDAHTHADLNLMGMQTADDFHSATVAAACGGVTTIIDYAVPSPGETLMTGINNWIEKAKHRAVIDFGLHATVLEPTERNIAEMADIVAEGHTSFKIYMIEFGKFDEQAPQYVKVMAEAGRLGALVNIHCEDQCSISYLAEQYNREHRHGPQNFCSSRPPIAEGMAAKRALNLARLADVPAYLVHLSHEEGLDALNEARAHGQTVYGETRPIYLKLSEERLQGENGHLFTSWPPLRAHDQMDILWQGLQSDVLQTVATDHISWTREQKHAGKTVDELLPGMSHLETLLPLLYSDGVRKNRLSLERFVEVSSTNPARIFGLYPQKGVIQPGADADIVVFDGDKKVTVRLQDMHSKQDFEIYEGEEFTGWPVMTFSRGDLIVENGMVKAEPGRGRLLKRKRHAEL